jgi:hypothetical protein
MFACDIGASRRRDLETGLNLVREMRKYSVTHNEKTLTAWIAVIRSTMRTCLTSNHIS